MDKPSTSADELEVQDLMPARRPMRIAIVTETYPPEVNGVALTLARLVDGLQGRGHEVQLVRLRQAASDVAQQDARFHEVLMRGLPIPRYPDLRMGVPSKRALVRLWSTRRPDLVHIATEGPLGWSALQAGQHLRLPITTDFRTNFHAYSQHYGVGWLRKPIMGYLRKFHNAGARTFVPTQALQRDLAACGLRGLSVVGRGVDTDLFNPGHRSQALRESWGATPQTPVLLCVGRLAPEKNLDLVVQAYAAARAVSPAARLVLVGDGPMRAALQARCPTALFAGQRAGTDLAAHYASADFFVFPSTTETFGNVVPEAMASALPVLAFRRAAAQELIDHGRTGWLAPHDDALAFIELAAQALRHPQAMATMGLAARARALENGWDEVISRFEVELREVLCRHLTTACVDLAMSVRPFPAR